MPVIVGEPENTTLPLPVVPATVTPRILDKTVDVEAIDVVTSPVSTPSEIVRSCVRSPPPERLVPAVIRRDVTAAPIFEAVISAAAALVSWPCAFTVNVATADPEP